MELNKKVYQNRFSESGELEPWCTQTFHEAISEDNSEKSIRTTERLLESQNFLPEVVQLEDVLDENGKAPKQQVQKSLEAMAKSKRVVSLVLQVFQNESGEDLFFVNDGRGGRHWLFVKNLENNAELTSALSALATGRNVLLWPHGKVTERIRSLAQSTETNEIALGDGKKIRFALPAYQGSAAKFMSGEEPEAKSSYSKLSNLDELEAESISILREVVAQAENPAMLFSLGKDSCVMLHLAKKAFYPSKPPFPLVHVDTRWKFQEMYQFRDEIAASSGMDLIVHINPDAIAKDINPFDHGSELHTQVTKTEGLKQVLENFNIDVAIGGARRDEEKSRAKERVFSFRSASHRWDPKKQRPELWSLYNGYKKKGESIRAFPLSNWTELDIWQYIYREKISIIPLYFADYRPVVERDGTYIMLDDDRMQLLDGEEIQIRKVRFRTLGCYPVTGAFESEASDIASIVLELLQSNTSERQGRLIDSDSDASMEKKKQEGYF